MIQLLAALGVIWASAVELQTSYLSVQLPDDWSCRNEGIQYVCHSSAPDLNRRGVLISSAKTSGPEDTLAALSSQLAKPRQRVSPSGPELSKVNWVRPFNRAGQDWVEALHLGSEAHNHFTHYWVTQNSGLSVMLTLTYDANLAAQFDPVVRGIRGTLVAEVIGVEAPDPGVLPDPVRPEPTPLLSDTNDGSQVSRIIILLSIVGIAAAAAIVVLKR